MANPYRKPLFGPTQRWRLKLWLRRNPIVFVFALALIMTLLTALVEDKYLGESSEETTLAVPAPGFEDVKEMIVEPKVVEVEPERGAVVESEDEKAERAQESEKKGICDDILQGKDISELTCEAHLDPVCGILQDGTKKTFGNLCTACLNSIQDALEGKCGAD